MVFAVFPRELLHTVQRKEALDGKLRAGGDGPNSILNYITVAFVLNFLTVPYLPFAKYPPYGERLPLYAVGSEVAEEKTGSLRRVSPKKWGQNRER